MSPTIMTIIAIVTIVIWIVATREINQSSEEKNDRKTVMLMVVGSLLTFVLTIVLFQTIDFLRFN